MQNIDPNIKKFIEIHYIDIVKGRINTVVNHVKDYLFKVTNPYQASRELAKFMIEIRKLRED